MATARFGTAINCTDGRVQEPVSRWLRKRYQLDYVDVIAEPGPDKILAHGNAEAVEAIKAKVRISVEKHGSNVIAIAGHHDCAGNPVTREEHLEQIVKCVQVMNTWNFSATRLGLWINENWEVELVTA
jgi:hypothetical protein